MRFVDFPCVCCVQNDNLAEVNQSLFAVAEVGDVAQEFVEHGFVGRRHAVLNMPGEHGSSEDQSQEGVEEFVTVTLMTPSGVAGRQVGSDASDASIFATPGDALPTSVDRLAAELVEFRAERYRSKRKIQRVI